MRRVELIYDDDCPNVESARELLSKALEVVGLRRSWIEWVRKSPGSPDYVDSYGSPTILVDGTDVANAEPGDGNDCCRVYYDAGGRIQGVPSLQSVVKALTSPRS